MSELGNMGTDDSGRSSDGSITRPRHENHCFVVMPFGRDAEEERWFRGWYHTVIEPVIVSSGYTPVLSASEDQPGAINDEIRAHLVFDPMIVVDLGGRKSDDPPNPNVMYELGIRHAFGLPLVIMAWEGQRLPFDVSNQRAIMARRDFMDIEPTRQKLGRFIQSAREGKYYNPMESVGREAAIDATSLVLGEESLLAALANEVRELRTTVTSQRSRSENKRWNRNRRARNILGKDNRAELWILAQQIGLNATTWSKFLGSPAPEVLDEMPDWSIDEWKRYLIQKAPELIEADRIRQDQKVKRDEEEQKAFEQLLEATAKILPKQPWPTGTHRNIADQLQIPLKQATKVIQELIRRGVFQHQINGVLVDAEAPRLVDSGTDPTIKPTTEDNSV